MMLSACDECLNKRKRGCLRFPSGKPKGFRPYIDMCDELKLPVGNVPMAPWETFPEYDQRIHHHDGPYNDEFIAKCKIMYREYSARDAFSRQYSIDELMRCVPLHFRNDIIQSA